MSLPENMWQFLGFALILAMQVWNKLGQKTQEVLITENTEITKVAVNHTDELRQQIAQLKGVNQDLLVEIARLNAVAAGLMK